MKAEVNILKAAGIINEGASVEKTGSGFNADGYRITHPDGTTRFARILNPGLLGNNTALERALSATEGATTLPHTLQAIPIGITEDGVIDLRKITEVVTVGEFMPDGAVNFLKLLRQEKTDGLAGEVAPLALRMAEVMADIHNGDMDISTDAADRAALYSRSTRRVIHDSELTAELLIS